MNIITAFSNHTDTQQLCQDVITTLREAATQYNVLVAYFNIEHDVHMIQSFLTEAFACPILLASSCQGTFAITPTGEHPAASLSVFGIADPDGAYGVGYARVNADTPDISAQKAMQMAVANSGRPYDTPVLIWTIMPPGQEESLITGFSQIIGPNVPVFGGSSADNDVSGNWFQATQDVVAQDLVMVLVMHPSKPVGYSYSSGYEPTDVKFVAQDCTPRQIGQLNGQVAAQEYNTHTHSSIAESLTGGVVIGSTTLYPLGRPIHTKMGVTEYLLSHPDSVTPTGELSLFSAVTENETFVLMQGSVEALVKRAAVVAQNALDVLPEGSKPAGILMIYCAGCRLTIDDDVLAMQNAVLEQIGQVPVVAAYTFGEQGCFSDGKNRHGNLMISAVAFSQ